MGGEGGGEGGRREKRAGHEQDAKEKETGTDPFKVVGVHLLFVIL